MLPLQLAVYVPDMSDQTHPDATREYFDTVASQWDEMRRTFFGDGVRQAVIRAANVGSSSVVADVGTGTGFLAEAALAAGARVIGIDASQGMLDQVRSRFPSDRFEARAGNVEALPLGGSEADAVIANMVLHHAENAPLAIREMVRVLKPGGMLVISDADEHAEAASVATPSRQRECVFISYSHADALWLERLKVHIAPLVRDGIVEYWEDTQIRAGADWRREISAAIAKARAAILLLSADFLASEFIATNELPLLLEAARDDGAVILPLIVSPCRFLKTPSLSRFQSVNPSGMPLIAMSRAESEAMLVKVTDAIEDVFLTSEL